MGLDFHFGRSWPDQIELRQGELISVSVGGDIHRNYRLDFVLHHAFDSSGCALVDAEREGVYIASIIRLLHHADIIFEHSIIVKRLVLDRPTASPLDTFSWGQVLDALTSPHVFINFCMLFMNGTMLFGTQSPSRTYARIIKLEQVSRYSCLQL